MSGTQQLRLFIQDRLTLAAEEIFGVVEKTISEYEEQVVQSKRELEQLRQDTTHQDTLRPSIQLYRTDSRAISEELLPLQQLNLRQELMSSQEDEVLQHHSPQVKEEQPELSFIPHSETSVYNSGTVGFVESQTASDSQIIPSYSNESLQHQSPQVKEEQVDSEPSILNIVTHGFGESESATSDSHLIPSYTTSMAAVQHSTRAKQDLCVVPCSETSIYNSGANGFVESFVTFVTSESAGDILTHSDDVFCIEQKICRICRRQFPSYAELSKHVEGSHAPHKAFKCPECDREFSRKNLWADHYRIHTGARPHACPVCGKAFTQVANLKAHVKIHTGVKNHACPVCGSRFSRSTTLRDHMRVHTGLKPHACSDCGRLFADRSNLNVHMKTHSGDRPHSCTVCGKSYIQRSCLKTHMRVHEG